MRKIVIVIGALGTLSGCQSYNELEARCSGNWETPPGNIVVLDDQAITDLITGKNPDISTKGENPCLNALL